MNKRNPFSRWSNHHQTVNHSSKYKHYNRIYIVYIIQTIASKINFSIKQLEDEITKVDEKRGFLNILLKISKCRTPIVFHAGLLDLLLTMKQFFLPALPPTLDEFKSATLAVFPHIFGRFLSYHLMVRTVWTTLYSACN